MRTEVVVRRVAPDDWASFRDIRLAALADAPSAFITTVAQAERFPEQLWRERIETSPHFLAETDGQAVGMIVVIRREEAPEVVGVWVRPDARGAGVIDGLLDAAAGWARSDGATELRLWVVEGNGRAERAYERHGYRRTGGSQPVPGRPDETEIEMALPLDGHVQER